MTYNIDAKKLSELLTTQDIVKVLESLGARQYNNNNPKFLLLDSICHHRDCKSERHKPKLYLNTTTHYMNCFSCGEGFNIYELVMKRKQLLGEKCNFPQSLQYVCDICGIEYDKTNVEVEKSDTLCDWQSCVNRYLRNESRITEEKIYDDSVLEFFDNKYHKSWLDNNISFESMDMFDIKWYNREQCIVIPCRNMSGELVGIRGRFFDGERKYMPVQMLNGNTYEFPTNNYLFGIWKTKDGIKKYKKCLIMESEKAVLQSQTFFGDDNFCVGLYGKNISNEKRDQIMSLNPTEIVIGLDFDYCKVQDDDFKMFEKNVMKIADKFRGYCNVSALVSYNGHNKKDSATDLSKEQYLKLWKEREGIY